MDKYGRYEIIQEIGKGSMGIVYKAHDPQIDRIVALKVLRRDRLTSRAFIDRFLKEARAVGRLSHPNIVTIYDIGQDHGTIYIAMEYLEGQPLSNLIKKGALSLNQVINIGVQVADALDYAHKKGIIHRDIKPSNIIVNGPGNVKLTDFGIAHIEDPDLPSQTQAGEILGTPAYMSPEQVLGRPVSGKADIFSLGIVLYEMLTGKRPFRGDNLSAIFNSITSSDPVPPEKINPLIPNSLSKVILKCLQKDPKRRFETAKDLKLALVSVKIDEGKVPKRTQVSRGILLTLIGTALILIMILAGYFYFIKNKEGFSQKAVVTSILDVTSIPPDASIFVDGNFKGRTPRAMRLKPGPHEIRITKVGYFSWEAQINLKENKTVPLNVRLIKE